MSDTEFRIVPVIVNNDMHFIVERKKGLTWNTIMSPNGNSRRKFYSIYSAKEHIRDICIKEKVQAEHLAGDPVYYDPSDDDLS